MPSVRRLFVEKRAGFDGAAAALLHDLRHTLGINALERLRVALRYDASGIADEDWDKAKRAVFSEAAVDELYEGTLDTAGAAVVAVEYLPGQFDQRADSAAQCIQLLTRGERPEVRCATVYLLYGGLTENDIDRIKAYLINPVDSREAEAGLPGSLEMKLEYPGDIAVLEGFTGMPEERIAAVHGEMGLAMSVADLLFVQKHCREAEKRDPTAAEIRVMDTYWSDHCRHTTFLTELQSVELPDAPGMAPVREAWEAYLEARGEVYAGREPRPVCLMDAATMGAKLLKKRGKLAGLDESPEINACSFEAEVEIDGRPQPWLIEFKNETHNHPTEIEPFGGAATCLGGAIRDPLSMRAYVYQAMRVTGSADPRAPMGLTIPGKLPQRKITREAAHGFSSYGNQIGLATGQVTEYYHPGYAAKRMELGAVIGAVPKAGVRREEPSPGDAVILVGGRTGRDGIGGATGSSKAHTAQSIETCGAEVQKGNPPTERKLQRLFRDPAAQRLIKRCNDFGAGGVSVAVGELAPGLDIDLDAVPRKYEGLDGTELAISESQERMAVVVAEADAAEFMRLASEENLEATPIARVTDTGRMRMTWRGRTIVDISREFLDTNGAPQRADALVAAADVKTYFERELPTPLAPERRSRGDVAGATGGIAKNNLLSLLSSLNDCSQRGLGEMFDGTIGAGTVLMPFGGRNQMTPAQAMAALVPVREGRTETCTLMAHGFFPRLSELSPFHGAVYAVVESLARVAAAGGDISGCWLSLQEYFERMTGDPAKWGKPLSALLGAFWAQTKLGVAAIGGKDSMSGSFTDMHVPPTLVSFAVCVSKAGRTISAEFKRPGSALVLLRTPRDACGLPDIGAFRVNCAAVSKAIAEGKVLAAHTVGEAGAAAAAAKMAFGNGIGADIAARPEGLFSPELASFVVEVEESVDIPALFKGLCFEVIGATVKEETLRVGGEAIPLAELQRAWAGTLEGVFPTAPEPDMRPIKSKLYGARENLKPCVRAAKPRVLIPVFPGTNCEYDTARAFERAGAVADVFVVRNLTSADIAESMREFARRIGFSQIVCIPGGFSAGDEPDGSGKFIAALFRESSVADATMDLLTQRDGLMLGICNGFQALIKLGLVPYGEIRDMRLDSPTLTFNAIGRHQSRLARTMAVSVKSPWMANLSCGDAVTTAISHGEGRFVCAEEEFDRLLANGQIAMQYVDGEGKPTYDPLYNPNGSLHAVEAITSPDGRVLGKMGHNERAAEHCFKNVPGNYRSGIFEAGVEYFR
jgi:phosphoribosylformylglycinamidine synthase